jgi:hypothetical protein
MRLVEFKQPIRWMIVENKEGKNLHLEHLEDLVFLQGEKGAKSALQYVDSVRDMLAQGSTGQSNVTVKWDGAPAIFVGTDPSDGKFFVSTKGVFNANPKLVKSSADLQNFGSEGVREKLAYAFEHLRKLGIQDVLQGDLMYIDKDLETKDMEDGESILFQPNTITYAVPVGSELGKKINASKMGIIFHTTYTGDNLEDMTASFGADISGLNKTNDVWFDDATYKDVSGVATLTDQENATLKMGIATTNDAINKADFEAISNQEYAKLFQQYVNSRIKTDQPQIADPKSFANDFVEWYKQYIQKDISKLKNQDPQAPAVKKRMDLINNQNKYIKDNLAGIVNALAVYKDLIALKEQLIKKLNRIDGISTLVRTDTGYKVTNPEGFVAIGSQGNAVKLVDRLEFSRQNFSAVKNWSK